MTNPPEAYALEAFPRHAFPGAAGDALRIAYVRGWLERPLIERANDDPA